MTSVGQRWQAGALIKTGLAQVLLHNLNFFLEKNRTPMGIETPYETRERLRSGLHEKGTHKGHRAGSKPRALEGKRSQKDLGAVKHVWPS